MSSVSPPEVDQKRSRAGITVPMLFVLGGLTAVPPLTFDAYLPALPQVAADLGVPEAQIQLTLSACLLGIAFGQLFGGPVSDARGRRTPLLVGVLGYTFFSLACAVAPSAPALVGLRFGQGLLGGVAVVIARAIVRDRAEGAAAARVFSLLMLVGGLAPILAPLVGSALIEVTTWRGIFVFLAGLGAIGLVAVMKVLPETLAPADRHTGGIRDTLAVAGRVVRDRDVMGFVLTSAFASGALFFYISSSSFVFQDVYDLSPTAFSLISATNAIGLMAMGWVNATLVRHRDPAHLLTWGVGQLALGAIALCVVLWAGWGLPAVLPCLMVAVISLPLIIPNATALALGPYGREAGTVSAFVGVVQFAVGAIASPLAGIAGETTQFSMAFGMLTMAGLSLLARVLLAPRERIAVVLEEAA